MCGFALFKVTDESHASNRAEIGSVTLRDVQPLRVGLSFPDPLDAPGKVETREVHSEPP